MDKKESNSKRLGWNLTQKILPGWKTTPKKEESQQDGDVVMENDEGGNEEEKEKEKKDDEGMETDQINKGANHGLIDIITAEYIANGDNWSNLEMVEKQQVELQIELEKEKDKKKERNTHTK